MSAATWMAGLAFVVLVIAALEWLSRDEDPLGWTRHLERWKDRRSQRPGPRDDA